MPTDPQSLRLFNQWVSDTVAPALGTLCAQAAETGGIQTAVTDDYAELEGSDAQHPVLTLLVLLPPHCGAPLEVKQEVRALVQQFLADMQALGERSGGQPILTERPVNAPTPVVRPTPPLWLPTDRRN